jgi:GNAT superfamily N-acetyltransferase
MGRRMSGAAGPGFAIVRPETRDRAGWRRLYDAYAAFYKREMTDAAAARVWAWIADPGEHGPCEGRIARDAAGNVVGLAHFRDMASPLRGAVVGFLDDLFVDPAWRGKKLGRALLDEVAAIGRARGWPFYRWLTADDNYRARTLYDQVATRTMWLTYQYDLQA